MLSKKQRKQNNSELAKSIGLQLNTIRKDKKILLENIEIDYDISAKVIDRIESGYRLMPINYLQYLASVYDKKIVIKFEDN